MSDDEGLTATEFAAQLKANHFRPAEVSQRLRRSLAMLSEAECYGLGCDCDAERVITVWRSPEGELLPQIEVFHDEWCESLGNSEPDLS